MMSVKWEGDKVASKVERAQIEGINATMAAAAIHARRNHPWRNVTGILERSIGIAEHAKYRTSGAVGLWGSQDVRYALIHELGGQAGPGRRVTIPARPYLRPAADAQYPGLARRIKKAFAGGGLAPIAPRGEKVERIIAGAVERFG